MIGLRLMFTCGAMKFILILFIYSVLLSYEFDFEGNFVVRWFLSFFFFSSNGRRRCRMTSGVEHYRALINLTWYLSFSVRIWSPLKAYISSLINNHTGICTDYGIWHYPSFSFFLYLRLRPLAFEKSSIKRWLTVNSCSSQHSAKKTSLSSPFFQLTIIIILF